MKSPFQLIAVTVLLLAAGIWAVRPATTIRLAWDASPDQGVGYFVEWTVPSAGLTNRAYAGTNLTVTITNLPVGTSQFRAFAYALTETNLISDPSNEVDFTNRPSGPTNLIITLQISTNLTQWTDGPALLIPVPPQLAGQEFFRSRLDLK
jgi:hypothetical protein